MLKRNTKDLEALKAFLKTPQRIICTMHARPDADALGTSLAVAQVLQQAGHQVRVVSPTPYPNFLSHFPGMDEVQVFEETAEQLTWIQEATLIFCIDFNSLSRLEKLGPYIEQSAAPKVMLDHHEHPTLHADFSLWDPKAPASAVIAYRWLMSTYPNELTYAIASNLYAGILTDTGGFQHSGTTAEVHRIVAHLIEQGVDPHATNQLIYGNQKLNRLRFMGFALYRRLALTANGRAGYIVITPTDRHRFELQLGDTEGLVNYILRLEGVEIAVLLSAQAGTVRFSFRSKGRFPVNKLASTHFNGGGHRNAAGGALHLPLAEAKQHLEKILTEILS